MFVLKQFLASTSSFCNILSKKTILASGNKPRNIFPTLFTRIFFNSLYYFLFFIKAVLIFILFKFILILQNTYKE